MSDLAKKCADQFRATAIVDRAFEDIKTGAENDALAAFIEAAQALRTGSDYATAEWWEAARTTYDTALRNLAQSMEVSDD